MIDAEYVLPLRWDDDDDDADADGALSELAAYLQVLSALIDVTVVDGSAPAAFARHASAFPAAVRHLPVEPRPGRNGKVAGVMTGVRASRHERIVLGDDDVRYDASALATVVDLLGVADVVTPQNFFAPLPWHARWDTARILLNRALAHDYPGTLALRRSALPEEGYDGDVLFENLELIRTVRAAGGTHLAADDCLVARRPPSAAHFLRQRVRQAYDSFAQPGRLAAELLILPVVLVLAVRAPRWLPALGAVAVAAAEAGRRRGDGVRHGGRRTRRAFPATSALWAPLWLLERGVCAWIAVGLRLRGGVRYSDGRLAHAGNSLRALRARYQ
ncbi:glycosyltransferase [Leifsonia sp. PS1209]|uniref:glycosyltransferase n=1 Tax=Leifsonia sp. PS1209 TaxID=2724914 RepID=UPI001442A8F0|nr:glycosyltransferase [Leifsonia sp. PS1209]QJA00066.1 glycosyltransferase family 2 protein [Leifsonia sp. PS1209]